MPLLAVVTSNTATALGVSGSEGERSSKVGAAIGTTLMLSTSIGLLQMALLVFGGLPGLALWGAGEHSPLRSSAAAYLILRAVSAPLSVALLALQGIFRGLGDKSPAPRDYLEQPSERYIGAAVHLSTGMGCPRGSRRHIRRSICFFRSVVALATAKGHQGAKLFVRFSERCLGIPQANWTPSTPNVSVIKCMSTFRRPWLVLSSLPISLSLHMTSAWLRFCVMQYVNHGDVCCGNRYCNTHRSIACSSPSDCLSNMACGLVACRQPRRGRAVSHRSFVGRRICRSKSRSTSRGRSCD